MDLLRVAKIVAAHRNDRHGATSILSPRSTGSLTGLSAVEPRAMSEIRAVLGALLVGLGAAAFFFRSPDA